MGAVAMRIVRFLTILLTVLALNNQALAAVTRVADVRPATAAQSEAVTEATDTQAHLEDAAHMSANMTHMECCDPDLPKPCDAFKDGSCNCQLGHGCQVPQIYPLSVTLTIGIASTRLIPSERLSTRLIAHSPPRLLRPPIY